MQILCLFFFLFLFKGRSKCGFFHLAVLFRFYRVLFLHHVFLSEQIKMMMMIVTCVARSTTTADNQFMGGSRQGQGGTCLLEKHKIHRFASITAFWLAQKYPKSFPPETFHGFKILPKCWGSSQRSHVPLARLKGEGHFAAGRGEKGELMYVCVQLCISYQLFDFQLLISQTFICHKRKNTGQTQSRL